MKHCITCDTTKPFDKFYKRSILKSGEQSYYTDCKKCNIIRARQWQIDNQDQYRHNQLMIKFGISLTQFKEVLEKQNNCCAICHEQFTDELKSHVDHCHTNENVRGILCPHCNMGLGHFFEKQQNLKNAANYLDYHAKQNPLTPISDEDNWEGEIHPQHGSVSTTGSRQDSYDLDHYQRTVRGEDADYWAQTRGGDGVGHGSEEVGTSKVLEGFKNYWNAVTKVGWP